MMQPPPGQAIPLCRDAPHWGFCGDPRGQDFGTVFIQPAANGGVMLSYDRRGRQHAITLFDARDLGAEIVLQGVRFTVARPEAA